MTNPIRSIVAAVIVAAVVCGCLQKEQKSEPYETVLFNYFDTVTQLKFYASDEAEFNKYAKTVEDSLSAHHKMFDIYHDYEGVNNLKTVNDNAGIKPVVVDKAVIDFLELAKKADYATSGQVNVALGSVLSIWHDYRASAIENPDKAKLPERSALEAAALLCDTEDIMIDKQNNTVYLMKKGMSIDPGGLAKGYAAGLAADAAKAQGLESGLLDCGGNIVSIGKPKDSQREKWSIGIQDPDEEIGNTKEALDVVFVNDAAIVSSGDYQRYFMVDGKRYGHVIDPQTLMPAENFRAVTVVCGDSAIADMLSTAIFIMPYKDGRLLADSYDAAVIWVLQDGSIKYNAAYSKISSTFAMP